MQQNIFKLKNIYLFIGILSILILIGAIYIEFVFGAKPCKLCIYQRYPYIIAIFLSFFGYINSNNKILLYFIIINFIISLILSIYHTGIENNFFSEYGICDTNNILITDTEKLLNLLEESMPSCKDVLFRIFGLSLATINVLISILIIVMLILIKSYEKNK